MVKTLIDLEGDVLQADAADGNGISKLAQILIESIPADRKQLWAGRVMAYLAEKTIQAVSEGGDLPEIATKEIHADLGGNPNLEPSAWLSPLWKDIEQRYYPEIEEVLIERARAAGLNVYPAIEKRGGKQAYYWLGSKEIPAKSPDLESVASRINSVPSAIQYQKDLSLQLSFAGKIFFGSGMHWTPLKRYSFITWHLLSIIGTVAYVSLVGLVLWYGKEALSSQHLVLLALGIGVPWVAYHHAKNASQLFEDRIIIAPEWMLAWKEFGATMEISRSKNAATPSTIHVNRYTATCPICGWMVKLDKGEPDFPRRIVGRCEENPREHVFSFDRSTRLGLPLQAILPENTILPSKIT